MLYWLWAGSILFYWTFSEVWKNHLLPYFKMSFYKKRETQSNLHQRDSIEKFPTGNQMQSNAMQPDQIPPIQFKNVSQKKCNLHTTTSGQQSNLHVWSQISSGLSGRRRGKSTLTMPRRAPSFYVCFYKNAYTDGTGRPDPSAFLFDEKRKNKIVIIIILIIMFF